MSLPSPLDDIRRTPEMYLRSRSFDVLVAFVDGYNSAASGGLLVGFREWLIVRAGDGNNLSWSQLILLLMPCLNSDEAIDSFEGIFTLLDEFLEVRHQKHGLRTIYSRYEAWLHTQSWYDPASPSWLPRE